MEGEKTREEVEKSRIIDTWMRKHRLIYTGATKHPFILSIRDGTVDLEAFKTWLLSRALHKRHENSYQCIVIRNKTFYGFVKMGQDYIFVRAFAPFVASVLIKAWKESDDSSDMEVILSGMASLNDEIAWFKSEATKWGVQLSEVVPQKANQDYCRFLESLMSPDVEYTVAITAFWAIEAVYQASFALCLEDGSKTPAELRETCRRWGNDGFGQYCNSLQKIANRRLGKTHDDVLTKAEVTLLRVLEHEVEFWNMSRGVA